MRLAPWGQGRKLEVTKAVAPGQGQDSTRASWETLLPTSSQAQTLGETLPFNCPSCLAREDGAALVSCRQRLLHKEKKLNVFLLLVA